MSVLAEITTGLDTTDDAGRERPVQKAKMEIIMIKTPQFDALMEASTAQQQGGGSDSPEAPAGTPPDASSAPPSASQVHLQCLYYHHMAWFSQRGQGLWRRRSRVESVPNQTNKLCKLLNSTLSAGTQPDASSASLSASQVLCCMPCHMPAADPPTLDVHSKCLLLTTKQALTMPNVLQISALFYMVHMCCSVTHCKGS